MSVISRGLLARVGLRDQQVVEVHAELAGVDRIERVLGIHEGADTALLLGFGDRMKRQRRLAGRFGTVDLDYTAAGQTADAEGDVEPERTGGDGLDLLHLVVLAEPHDRALAEGTLDLGQGGVNGLGLVLVHRGHVDHFQCGLGHLAGSL
ncbi:hypothetical protein ABIE45_004830 [Methylobacterium sp. OAE515]